MTNPVKKMIARRGMRGVRGVLVGLVVLGALAGFGAAAFAQASTGPAASGAAAGSAASEPPSPTPPPSAPPPASDARKACTDAMNADPTLAEAIVKIADEKAAAKRDADTIEVHTQAVVRVQKNEQHVIYAYAAMWIVAALFVIFLWRRQQMLKVEIASLRRDLEAAANEATSGKARS